MPWEVKSLSPKPAPLSSVFEKPEFLSSSKVYPQFFNELAVCPSFFQSAADCCARLPNSKLSVSRFSTSCNAPTAFDKLSVKVSLPSVNLVNRLTKVLVSSLTALNPLENPDWSIAVIKFANSDSN